MEQISNRYTEMSFFETNNFYKVNVSKISVKDPHDKGPLLSNCFSPQFSKLKFPYFIISLKSSNNCCRIGKDIVCLKNIATSSVGNYVATGRKFQFVEELYNNPCSSARLSIFKVNYRLCKFGLYIKSGTNL